MFLIRVSRHTGVQYPVSDCRYSSDVIIAGAGPAGISAALAAAGEGAECLLLEARESIGGTVSHTGIFSLCGFFPVLGHEASRTGPCLPGSPELVRWIEALGASPVTLGRVRVLPVTPWHFFHTALDLLQGYPCIRTVTATPLSPGMRLRAQALVDCTGDAALARAAGVETREIPGTCPGLGFVFTGVHTELLAPGAMDVMRAVCRHFKDCSLRLFTSLPLRMYGKEAVPGMLNLTPELADLPASRLREAAEKRLSSICAFLRKAFPALRHASVCWCGPYAGLRSGHVIKGRQCLEFAASEHEDTSAVRGLWPAEVWQEVHGAEFHYAARGFISIPDDCLRTDFPIPFFAAGKCISTTPLAQASVRVVGTCIDTGARAGRLAARAAAEGVRYEIRI